MNKPRATLANVLLITFLALGSLSHAQNEMQKEAFLVDSFGLMPNGDFKGRSDTFMSETRLYPESRALIVIYGPSRQVEARKRLINEHFSFRQFPMAQLETKVGGNVSDFRTEFWIIPKGAAPPEIKPEAWIYGEFGRAYKRDIVGRFKLFVKEVIGRDQQGYIINYGSPKEIALRERWMSESVRFRTFDPPRITIVNGGPGPVRTVMWLVPPGAENPEP